MLMLFCAGCSQAPARQSPPPRPPLEVVGEWGEAGKDPGKLQQPLSLATDRDGLVFVADAGSGFVHKFDWNGQALFSFEHPRMKRPAGIAVDRGGAIYVADDSADRVFIFRPDGRLIRELRGGPRARFDGPVGVAVDEEGLIYVLEFNAHRIQKFTARGRLVSVWGREGNGPGEFSFPADLAIGPDGYLYVADTGNHRVQKFTRDGEFVSTWGQAGVAAEQMNQVAGIAVAQQFVFLADSGNRRVAVWTPAGTLRMVEDLHGRLTGTLKTPADVAVGRNGELLVLDSAGPRILRVKVNF